MKSNLAIQKLLSCGIALAATFTNQNKKNKTLKPIILTILTCAFTAAIASAEPDKPKDPAAAQDAPVEFRGEEPRGVAGLKTLAAHRVIAEFDGTPYRVCNGATGACPERCGSSGEYATFRVKDYLYYAKWDKYGDDKNEVFAERISDFHKKPAGDQKLNEVIARLKKGDLVLLESKHLFGELSPRASGPVRPLLYLKKLSPQEVDDLRAQAKAEADALLARKQDGSYDKPEEFAKRLSQHFEKFRAFKPSEMATITKLDFHELPLTDDDIVSIGKLTQLESLSLYRTGIKPESLGNLRNLKSLKHLDISWVLYRSSKEQRNAALLLLKEFPSLESLALSTNDITDDELDHLKNLSSLRHLDLSWHTYNITDKGLAAIGALKKLESLDLSENSTIKGSGIVHLVDLPRLQTLNLSSTGVGDEALEHIGKMKSLRELNFYNSLNFSATSLNHLKGLLDLKVLNLRREYHSKMTPAEVNDLRRALPNCKIHGPGDGKDKNEEYQGIVALAKTDLEKATNLAKTLKDPLRRAWAMHDIAALWAEKDLEKAAALALMVEQHGRGQLYRIVSAFAKKDPKKAAEWAATIKDDNKRAQVQGIFLAIEKK